MNRGGALPSPRPLEPEDFAEGLRGTRFEDHVVLHLTVSSTIDICRGLADRRAPEGTTVLAEEQRHGRGQRDRGWFSPRGKSVYLSTLLRPALPPAHAPDLVALAGLAASEALHEACELSVVLRRPNDLMVQLGDRGWRKLGGLLVDTVVQGERLRHAIVSLGLNVNQRSQEFPDGLRDTATSLREATGRSWPRQLPAIAFLRRLEDTCRVLASPEADEGLARLLARYEERAVTLSPPGAARAQEADGA